MPLDLASSELPWVYVCALSCALFGRIRGDCRWTLTKGDKPSRRVPRVPRVPPHAFIITPWAYGAMQSILYARDCCDTAIAEFHVVLGPLVLGGRWFRCMLGHYRLWQPSRWVCWTRNKRKKYRHWMTSTLWSRSWRRRRILPL